MRRRVEYLVFELLRGSFNYGLCVRPEGEERFSFRITPEKVWGGGTVTAKWRVSRAELRRTLRQALGLPDDPTGKREVRV